MRTVYTLAGVESCGSLNQEWCAREHNRLDAEDLMPDPIMPHRHYRTDDLDALFPKLGVPADDDHDHHDDGDDQLLKEGSKIADAIAVRARTHGRRKSDQGVLLAQQ